jgi:predicted RNA-binding Zn ribbon-like protein
LLEAGVSASALAARAEDVADAHRLREALYRSFLALIDGSPLPRHSVGVVNRFAAAPAARPRLTTDSRRTWHADDPVPAALAAVAADGIDLLAGPLTDRIRECAAPDCAFLFLDTSRARRRRWCASDRCGNREHVRAHRRRRR